MNGRRGLGIITAVAGGALALAGVVLAPGVASASHGIASVTICQATVSEGMPYVAISVSADSVDGVGANDHSAHVGPIWYPGAKSAGVVWGDIIPPVSGVTAGMNWSAEGQAIYLAHCSVPAGNGDSGTPTTAWNGCSAEGECPQPCTNDGEFEGDQGSENEGDGNESEMFRVASHGAGDITCIPDMTLPPETTLPPDTLPPSTEITLPPETVDPPASSDPATTTATTAPATTDVASAGPTSSAAPVTTDDLASGGPTTAVVDGADGSLALPTTGSGQTVLIVIGLLMVLGGVVSLFIARRPDEV